MKPSGTGRGPGTHLCPVAGCELPVSAARLMCRADWYRVPKSLRDAVWATWRSGDGAASTAHAAAIRAAVRAAETVRAAR